jgi:hypothetical protein
MITSITQEEEIEEAIALGKADYEAQSNPQISPPIPFMMNGVEWDLSRSDHLSRWLQHAGRQLAHHTMMGNNALGVVEAKRCLYEILDAME